MKCTPATYIASLYRQVLMKEALNETFKGQDNLLQEFQEKMGVQLKWQAFIDKGTNIPYSVRWYYSSFGDLGFLSKRSSKRK